MKVYIIGTRLKELRHEKNLTQKDLASIMGITPQAVAKKEKLDKTTLEEVQVRLVEEQVFTSRDFLTGKVDKSYERLFKEEGKEEKILIKPLIKDVHLNPILYIAKEFDKKKIKTTLAVMKYISKSNDLQLDLIKNICDTVFKTVLQEDNNDKKEEEIE